MSLNAFMHERNPYKDKKPDFFQLAKTYPEFARHCDVDVHGKINFDFKNPEAVRMLTWALLKSDFSLDVHIPPGTLVPRIPLRLNYILWIEDLINLQGGRRPGGSENLIHGIDIGTGASCIYPLLAARKCGWSFLATERDVDSWKVALQNVARNGFEGRITVVRADEGTALLPLLHSEPHCSQSFEFCMCNPPFYDISSDTVVNPNLTIDDESIEANSVDLQNSENASSTGTSCTGISMSGKSSRPNRPPPHSATVAKLTEVVAEGGEIRFVKRIIADSCRIRDRVRIYTSMVGKKSSLRPLKSELHRVGVSDVAETTFCQGRTVRWALAWTFCADVKLKDPKKPLNPLKQGKPVCGLYFDVARYQNSVDGLANTLLDQLAELKIITELVSCIESSDCLLKLRCRADLNTWSHQRRKRRDLQRLDNEIAAKHARKPDTADVGIMCFPRAMLVTPNDSPGPASAESGSCSKTSTLPNGEGGSRSMICETQLIEPVQDASNEWVRGCGGFGSYSRELPVNGDHDRKRTHSDADFDVEEGTSNAEGKRVKRARLRSYDAAIDGVNCESAGFESGGTDSADRISKWDIKDRGYNFDDGIVPPDTNNDLCLMSRTASCNESRKIDHGRISCDSKNSTDWPNLNNEIHNTKTGSPRILTGSLDCCKFPSVSDTDQLFTNSTDRSGFKSSAVQFVSTEPELSNPVIERAGEFCDHLAQFYLSVTVTNGESSLDSDSDQPQSGTGGSCFRVGFDWLGGSDRDGMQQIFTCLFNGMGVRSNKRN